MYTIELFFGVHNSLVKKGDAAISGRTEERRGKKKEI